MADQPVEPNQAARRGLFHTLTPEQQTKVLACEGDDTVGKSQTAKRAKPVYRLKAKPGELKAGWGRTHDYGEGPDICAAWQGPGAKRSDGNLLLRWFCLSPVFHGGNSFSAELEARGYDLTTLKFSIQQKPTPNAE